MSGDFHTIGHSTRSLEEFVELLQAAGIDVVVDVRTIPRSRRNPQFNRDTLPESLAVYGLGYEHMASLGGRRHSTLPVSPNSFWEHPSFRSYADYAMGPEFRSGLEQLRMLGHTRRCAIMCAEAVWWRCHRRIIADYLLASGERVYHIMGAGRIDPASITPAARPMPGGILEYPAAADP